MSQQVKPLLIKQENWGSDPRHPSKCRVGVMALWYFQGLEYRDKQPYLDQAGEHD